MAPHATGETWEYTAPGNEGYDIPDVTLNDPNSRHMRVVGIGAGVSGILSAYQIQKYCSNVTLRIYESQKTHSGTWHLNKYPGCGCDIPSHAYTYNFALNPDWPRFFSYSQDIYAYLDKVVQVFGLEKYMTFNTEVIGAWWQDEEGEWKVKLRELERFPNGEVKTKREFEERCDLLIYATGILNDYKWPDIKGLDKFKGRVVHTARWPDDYQAEQWKNDRVAVIGSGASSIQTVPTMQKHAKHLDVFVRTGVWFVEIAKNYGDNSSYTEEQKKEFREDPQKLSAHAKDIEDQVNGLWGAFYSDTPAQMMAQDMFKKRMAEFIKDERLLKGFTPEFGVGCRRVTPGDPYMLAIQEKNVSVLFTAVDEITEDGVIGADGTIRKCDTIVCATGFDVSYKPRFPLVGKSGQDLSEKWNKVPESYLGLAVPDFPNFLAYIFPTWPVENGSVMGPLLSVSEYMIQFLKKLQFENIKSLAPKQDVTDAFNEHCQEWIKHTVWKEPCRSWYRNNDTGRVNAVWPGSSLHFQHTIRTPRYQDFEIEYHNKRNMWAFLGMGWSSESRINFGLQTESIELASNQDLSEAEKEIKQRNLEARKKDPSPYINSRYIDPRWLAATGSMTKKEADEFVIRKTAERAADRVREELARMERNEGGSCSSTLGFDAAQI